jgi:hypothetical protein
VQKIRATIMMMVSGQQILVALQNELQKRVRTRRRNLNSKNSFFYFIFFFYFLKKHSGQLKKGLFLVNRKCFHHKVLKG